jgi:hydroxyisourate hydrolase
VTLSTHVLDTEQGRPAGGVPVVVERQAGGEGWQAVTATVTDADGRATDLVPESLWGPGRWRITFDLRPHHGAHAFWPEVRIDVNVADASHHHVPLLLARHGYTTYRGS